MSDDLVSELRDVSVTDQEDAKVVRTAADEIERLAGENEQLRELARWLISEDGNGRTPLRSWLVHDRPHLFPLFDSIVGGET